MEHIDKYDLILIASGRLSVVNQIVVKQQHLKSCQHCRKQLAEIKEQIQEIKTKNEEICESVFQQLSHSLENTHPLELSPEFQQHLEKCDDCRALHTLFKRLSIKELEETDIEIPEEKLEILTQKIFSAIRKMRGKIYLKPLITPLLDFKELFGDIRTIFVETKEKLSFSIVRGEILPDRQIFSYNGGKIKFRTVHPFKKVILYAIFNEKFYEKMTDVNGEVIFDNLVNDDYRIEIDGYEVKNISDIL